MNPLDRANWISVAGVIKDDILARICAFEPTTDPTPASVFQWEASVSRLPSGRILLFCNDFVFSQEMAAWASKGGEAIYGWTTPSELFTAAYADGIELWAIRSVRDRTPRLAVTGTPPTVFDRLVDGAEAEGGLSHAPLAIADKFGDFRPDLHVFGPEDNRRVIEVSSWLFQALMGPSPKPPAFTEPAPDKRAAKRGLFGGLFGRTTRVRATL